MLSKEQAYQIIDTVLKHTQGYDTRVQVSSNVVALTRFANSEIHQNVWEDRTSVSITITEGKRRSDVRTELIDAAGLKTAAEEAISNLKLLPEGQEQPPLVSEPEVMESDAFCPDLEQEFGTFNRARLLNECLEMLAPEYMAYGALTYSATQMALGNSKGIKRSIRSNSARFSALISDAEGGTGYTQASAHRAGDLDVVASFRTAYNKAQMNRNPIQIEPGAYTVILEPMAVATLLRYVASGFSGKMVMDRASFLTGKMGEQVFSEKLTMIDDHTHPSTQSLPFDFEGTPRQKVVLVEKGVPKGLVYDLASATRAGVESTGHSMGWPGRGGMPMHLIVEPGEQTLEEIIKNTDDAILVSRFHYMNPLNRRQAILTALTRDGVFHVKNGEIVAAVNNMRFTESMLLALKNIEAISSDRQAIGNSYVPALKIKNFHFTGKTTLDE
ncbi:MAG: TldD/PmbA family protein [Firmicutes bacterium]|nr:TldD/PmbA family protein [Bacillota bacterium]